MNYVTVEGRALAQAMKLACAIIERRNTIPVLNCVRLRYSSAGLEVFCTDLDIWLTIKVDEIAGDGEWEICIYGELLERVAKAVGVMPMKIEREEWEIPITDRGGRMTGDARTQVMAIITLGDGEARYELEQASDPADMPEATTKGDTLIERFTNGMLAETLDKVSWAISTEETRYYLNGVCWQGSDDGRAFTATDGHRLAKCAYSSDPWEASHIIPRKVVAFVSRHMKGRDVEIYSTGKDTILEFRAPGMVMVSKMIDGTFPDVARAIPKDHSFSFEFKTEEIASAIRRVMIIRDKRDRTRAVKLEQIDGLVSLAVKSHDFGSGVASTSTQWPAEGPGSIGFNAAYLLDILTRCQGMAIMRGSDSGAPFTVVDDDAAMTRVIMPMRV